MVGVAARCVAPVLPNALRPMDAGQGLTTPQISGRASTSSAKASQLAAGAKPRLLTRKATGGTTTMAPTELPVAASDMAVARLS